MKHCQPSAQKEHRGLAVTKPRDALPSPGPPWAVLGPRTPPTVGSACGPYLILAAFTRLEAGQDLALDSLDPRVSFFICGGFKVPRLASEGHNDELEVLLLL